MDFEELERHISEETKTLILCNPHNPTGNCWSAQDLATVGEICTKRGVVLLVDEIHCDLVTNGHKYTPFSTLANREIVSNSITFKSASKSFSLSAMKCGWMFSDNPAYIAKIVEFGHSQDFNTIGMVATGAAYTRGEDWLRQVLPDLAETPEVPWNRLAAEMRANIRLGLAAGECVGAARENDEAGDFGWLTRGRAALAMASLLVLVYSGLILQRPAPEAAALAPEGPLVQATENGIQVRAGDSAFRLMNAGAKAVTYSASADGSMGARYVDPQTGYVTINNVYVQ